MRSNKYRTHISPFLDEISQMARLGASEKEIAKSFGVSYSSFRKYKEDHAELKLRLAEGIELAIRDKELEQRKLAKQIAIEQTDPKTRAILEARQGSYAAAPAGGKRLDRDGTHRKAFELAKARIYATQETCGICGRPVDFNKKYPDPMSPCIDHIIPIARGGHPSDIDNLQLAHWACNRQKSDKMPEQIKPRQGDIGNRNLPQSLNWKAYKAIKK